DVLAISGDDGKIGPGTDAVVSGQVMETGRGDKILVFHFKRKKQYKKIYGHRQPYTEVRITEIAFDGQRFTAPELPEPTRRLLPNLLKLSHTMKPKHRSTRLRLRHTRKAWQRKQLPKSLRQRRALPKRAATKRKSINFQIKGTFESWHTKKD